MGLMDQKLHKVQSLCEAKVRLFPIACKMPKLLRTVFSLLSTIFWAFAAAAVVAVVFLFLYSFATLTFRSASLNRGSKMSSLNRLLYRN